MKKEELKLYEFRIEPKEEALIPIYEHFININKVKTLGYDLDYSDANHMKKMPTLKWYPKMEELINDYGYENYRNHLIETFESLLKLVRLGNRIKTFMSKEHKKVLKGGEKSEHIFLLRIIHLLIIASWLTLLYITILVVRQGVNILKE